MRTLGCFANEPHRSPEQSPAGRPRQLTDTELMLPDDFLSRDFLFGRACREIIRANRIHHSRSFKSIEAILRLSIEANWIAESMASAAAKIHFGCFFDFSSKYKAEDD
jgi:hypothetical protein